MLARVMIGAIVVLGFAQRVLAGCTCQGPGTCGLSWSSGQVIFLGKVTADFASEAKVVDDPEAEDSDLYVPGSIKRPLMNHEVHFSIAESFRGDGQPGQEIVVHTGVDERGSQDGDCSYPFVVGVSYVVYASAVGGSLSTSTCTFTSPEMAAGGLVRELRAIRDGRSVDSLFGTVTLLPRKADSWWISEINVRPLADISVRVIDSSGFVRSTKTDERGVYAFEWLPPDAYRIEQDLPAGLKVLWEGVLWEGAEQKLAVDLTDEDATPIGCRADIRARPDEQIPKN